MILPHQLHPLSGFRPLFMLNLAKFPWIPCWPCAALKQRHVMWTHIQRNDKPRLHHCHTRFSSLALHNWNNCKGQLQQVVYDVRAKYQEGSYQKVEAIPPRAEEPRQVPTAEANGLPNPAPRGPCDPMTHTQIRFILPNQKLLSFLGFYTAMNDIGR